MSKSYKLQFQGDECKSRHSDPVEFIMKNAPCEMLLDVSTDDETLYTVVYNVEQTEYLEICVTLQDGPGPNPMRHYKVRQRSHFSCASGMLRYLKKTQELFVKEDSQVH